MIKMYVWAAAGIAAMFGVMLFGVVAAAGGGASSPPLPMADTQPAAESAHTRFLALLPAFQRAEADAGVPWQIQAAQWALESNWGTATPKDLATGQESYNLFGIKGEGPAGSVLAWTTEERGGVEVEEVAEFRAYHSFDESVADHARLLTTDHYAPAHEAGHDLAAWALALQRLGYATDTRYAAKLWQIITANGWDQDVQTATAGASA